MSARPDSAAPATIRECDVIELARLKRFESPGDAYFDGLLERFHARQRQEILRASSRGLFFERLGVFLDSFVGGRWVAGGVAGYASLILGGIVLLQWSAAPEPALPGVTPVSIGAPSTEPAPGTVQVQFRGIPVAPLAVPDEPVAGAPAPEDTP